MASEVGDIERFASPRKLCGYTGLCPRVYQSGQTERRGPLAKNGARYLRWAYVEAATHAAAAPIYREHYLRTRAILGRFRGPKIARIEVARKLAGGERAHAHQGRTLRSGRPRTHWPPEGPLLNCATGRVLPSDLM